MSDTPFQSPKSLRSSGDTWISMRSISEDQTDSTFELGTTDNHEPAKDVKSSLCSLFAFATRKHTFTLFLAFLLAIFASLFRPASAIIFGKFFATITAFGRGTIGINEAIQQTAWWCIALTGMGGLAWITDGLLLSQWMMFGEQQARCVRELMFDGLLEKNMEWYDLRKDGIATLLSRIQTQIRELQMSVSQPFGIVIFEISSMIASLTIAFVYSWQLTLVIIATFPLTAFCLWLVSRNLAPAIEAQKRDLSTASKFSNTAMTAITTVKVFNGQDQEVWQYYNAMKQVTLGYLKQALANALQHGIIRFFTIAIFVTGFWYGFHLTQQGLDVANVVTTFYACLTALQGFEVVLPQWLVLTKGMSAGETLKSILKEIKDEKRRENHGNGLRPSTCEGDIEVNSVTFAYPSNPRQNVLSATSFFFPAGETTYIVGQSGSGKSTLGNLLLKYYEAHSGEILVDGQDINELDTNWLRERITLVQQQSILFNETIYQNIALGRASPSTIEEVWEAAKTADLEKTLSDLADGLNTLVGSNGKSLSGGQQQRVAIARARLRDTPILILDEATSALDQRSRVKVNDLIRQWRKGKTTIIITHDVTQILDNDYVYVMENGAVIQEGYRSKLVEKLNGPFVSFLPPEALISRYDSIARRNSEPTSPTSPIAESPEDEFSPRWSYISKVFGRDSPHVARTAFTRFSSNRFSMGIGSQQVNDLRADAIWASPTIPKREMQYQEPLTLGPPKSFRSPSQLPNEKVTQEFSVDEKGFYEVVTNPEPVYTRPSSEPHEHFKQTEVRRSVFGSEEQELSTPPSRSHSPPPPTAETSKTKKPTTLTSIFRTIWPTLNTSQRFILILGFIMATIVGAATPAFAYVFARLLGVFFATSNQSSSALRFSLILLGIAVIDAITTTIYHYSLEYCGQVWISALRVEGLKRVLAQPKSWFDKEKNSPGSITEVLDRNAEEMRNLLGRFAGPVYVAFWMLSISIVWAATVSWKLTLVALSTAPVMTIATRLFDWVSAKWEAKCNVASDTASTILTETFANIRVVRALTLENYFKSKHTKATIATFQTGKLRAVYSGIFFGLTDSMSFFISALIFWYGCQLLKTKELTVDGTLQVIQLLMFGIGAASATLIFVPQINSSRVTATQVLRLASLPLDSHELSGRRRVKTPLPVEMHNLSFSYASRPDKKILTDINLKLEPGTCTALVGPSGSGKSTIASIILGLYPPNAPTPSQTQPPLTFSTHPSSTVSTTSLRTHISLVPQQPTLFPTTILSNIIYGLPEDHPLATLPSAISAAKKAGIHDFIISLEKGYNTLIGDGGMGISGGQAQRIAIARALVRKPKILVLDEATSALDAVTGAGIRDVVLGLLGRGSSGRRESNNGYDDIESSGEKGKRKASDIAILTISHGTEMMKIADEIVMLENGRVVERGTFKELRAKDGRFCVLIGEKRESVLGRTEGVRGFADVDGGKGCQGEEERVGLGVKLGTPFSSSAGRGTKSS